MRKNLLQNLNKDMKRVFFREQGEYTRKDIAEIIDIKLDEVEVIVAKLIRRQIIKEEQRDKEKIYKFNYVGVVVLDKFIFICYPKYILEKDKPSKEMRQIIRVLQKYNSEKIVEQKISLYNGLEDENEFTLLSIVLFIVNDFINNGIYSSEKEIEILNGEGEINWDKSIDQLNPLIQNNVPYYNELFTKSNTEDYNNYFKKLHQYIIWECLNFLKLTGLAEIFDLENIEITIIGNFEILDMDIAKYRVLEELKIQFIDRKKMLLKTIYNYLDECDSFVTTDYFTLYGIKKFEHVWENVCSKVFNNKLKSKLKHLPLNLDKSYESKKDMKLIELIEKPCWITIGYNPEKEHNAERTLKPDCISIYNKKNKKYFSIIDAKYYGIVLNNETLSNNPGVADIIKQYFYQIAYYDFIAAHNMVDTTKNIFLFPSEDFLEETLGKVKIESIIQYEKVLNKSIVAVKVPAQKLYTLYLNENYCDFLDQFNFL